MNKAVSFFFAASTVILLLGYLYLGRKLIPTDAIRERHRRWLAWGGLGAVFAAIVLGRTLYRGAVDEPMNDPWLDAFLWGSNAVMGFVFILFFFFVAADLAGLGVRFARRVARGGGASPPDPSRRRFFRRSFNYSVAGVAGVLTAAGTIQAVRGPKVREVDVGVEGLRPELDGFRIAQISDLHVGPTIRRGYVEKVVEAANALEADVIAVTGDMVDGTVTQLHEHVAPLAGLRAREGVYYVTGNHEYYWGVGPWVDHFQSLGMTILHNRSELITRDGARLAVAGVTDYRAARHLREHRSSPLQAMKTVPDGVDFKLLLAHQPRSCFEAEEAGFDLQLSGHTHGGQFYPWGFFVHLAHPFTKGLGRMKHLQVYVNSGTGYWGPPNRLGIPSELTLVTLRSV